MPHTLIAARWCTTSLVDLVQYITRLGCSTSHYFVQWITRTCAVHHTYLCSTSHNSDTLTTFLIGLKNVGAVLLSNYTFGKCMLQGAFLLSGGLLYILLKVACCPTEHDNVRHNKALQTVSSESAGGKLNHDSATIT